MKRTTTTTYNNRPFKRPRSANWVYRAPAGNRPPRRVYTSVPSRAPVATRGFSRTSPEQKSFDSALLSIAFGTTGNFTQLLYPASGGDINQRVGRKLTIKSIYIKGRVGPEGASTLPSNVDTPASHARMIILVDYQPNGAVPLVSDVLNITSPSSQLNLGNRERFKVLCEKNYIYDPFQRVGDIQYTRGRSNAMVKKYCKVNIDQIWSGPTGSITDLKTGAIYMLWIANNVSPDACIFIGTTRVRYLDN